MPTSKATRKTTGKGKRFVPPATHELLAVAVNESLHPKERWTALTQMAGGVISDRTTFKAMIALLRDRSQASKLRNEALTALQGATFDPVAFAPFRSAYMTALRALRDDPDREIRWRAFGILMRESDADTQTVLLNGLEHPQEALLPAEKALQLLSSDAHAGAYDVARRIVHEPPNPVARREALRVLAADANSADLFEHILLDKNEPEPIRQLAASALNHLSPQRFQTCARDITVDVGESDRMKLITLTALTHFGDAETLSNDHALQETVDLMQAGSPDQTDNLTAAAKRFKQRYGA